MVSVWVNPQSFWFWRFLLVLPAGRVKPDTVLGQRGAIEKRLCVGLGVGLGPGGDAIGLQIDPVCLT